MYSDNFVYRPPGEPNQDVVPIALVYGSFRNKTGGMVGLSRNFVYREPFDPMRDVVSAALVFGTAAPPVGGAGTGQWLPLIGVG